MIELEPEEVATLLAALALYKERGCDEPSARGDEVHALATDNDRVVSLDSYGIAVLASKLREILA